MKGVTTVILLVIFKLSFAAELRFNQSEEITTHSEYQGTKGKVVCYYSAWAYTRPEPWNYDVKDIPAELCTDIIYAFVGINHHTWELSSIWPRHDLANGGYKKFTALRRENPDLKLLLAVGGWGEGGAKYSEMVSVQSRRDIFVQSAVKWVRRYGFDGFDLDWEHPGLQDRGGKYSDKDNFVSLAEELKVAFEPHKLLLTGVIPVKKSQVQDGYDVAKLAPLFDWISVKSYELRGFWVGYADVQSPLYRRHFDKSEYERLNVHDGLQLLVDMGAPRHKLIVGVPFFGRSYTLESKNATDFQNGVKKSIGGGLPGPYTRETGFLAYYEICPSVMNKSWTKKFDNIGKCPYAYHDNQWVGYEDEESVGIKMDYIREQEYGGAMAFATDLDDFRGVCGEKNALLKVMHNRLRNYVAPTPKPPKKLVPSTISPSKLWSPRSSTAQDWWPQINQMFVYYQLAFYSYYIIFGW